MQATLENKLIYSELSYKIIGCGMTVYNELGPNHKEKIYQKALEISLTNAGLKFLREAACPVYFQGKIVGQGRADIIVEEKIVLELKRTNYFGPADFKQLKNYLCAKNLELGIMFRFAQERSIYKRVLNLNPE